MKKFNLIILTTLLLVLSAILIACNCSEDHFEYQLASDKQSYIVVGRASNCIDSEIVIPSKYKSLPVSEIAPNAFSGDNYITKVKFSKNLRRIGNGAFFGCENLLSVTIPRDVVFIGDAAFRECVRLVEVYNFSDLPIEKGKDTVGYVAYYAKDVYLNHAISKLHTNIDGCVIHSDGKNKTLVAYHGDKKDLKIPNNITGINDYAFFRSDIQIVTFGRKSKLAYIGKSAFENCLSLSDIIIPGTVSKVGKLAFAYCGTLRSVSFGYNCQLTKIEDYAFKDCDKLTSVTIPDGITDIGVSSFMDCNALECLRLPTSLRSIGEHALAECDKLDGMYYEGTIEQWNEINIEIGNYVLTMIPIHCKGDIHEI